MNAPDAATTPDPPPHPTAASRAASELKRILLAGIPGLLVLATVVWLASPWISSQVDFSLGPSSTSLLFQAAMWDGNIGAHLCGGDLRASLPDIEMHAYGPFTLGSCDGMRWERRIYANWIASLSALLLAPLTWWLWRRCRARQSCRTRAPVGELGAPVAKRRRKVAGAWLTDVCCGLLIFAFIGGLFGFIGLFHFFMTWSDGPLGVGADSTGFNWTIDFHDVTDRTAAIISFFDRYGVIEYRGLQGPGYGWERSITLIHFVGPTICLLIPAAVIALRVWASRPRKSPWACQHCGYDLRGAASSHCSECGYPIPSKFEFPSPTTCS